MLGFTTFLDTAQISALERKLDELRRARNQTQARRCILFCLPVAGRVRGSPVANEASAEATVNHYPSHLHTS